MVSAHPTELTRLMLLSIKPGHVDNILSGSKTVELRRIRPQVSAGQPIAIYATMPVGAVVATCRVRKVDVALPEIIKPGIWPGGDIRHRFRRVLRWIRSCRSNTRR